MINENMTKENTADKYLATTDVNIEKYCVAVSVICNHTPTVYSALTPWARQRWVYYINRFLFYSSVVEDNTMNY